MLTSGRHWLQTQLKPELSGGFSVFLISLPQAIAYGSIAFFPLGATGAGIGIVSAIISSVVLCTITPIFGNAPGMAFGPRASSALVFASFLALLLGRDVDPASAVALCFIATCLSGLFQALLGLFRIGTLGQYVPYPLISGIMNGTAVIIVGRELMNIAGTDAPVLSLIVAGLTKPAALLAIGVATLIFVLRIFRRFLPPHLVGIIIGTAVYHGISAITPLDLGATYPPLNVNEFEPTGLFASFSTGLIEAFRQNWTSVVSAATALALLESLDTLISCTVHGRLIGSRIRGNRLLIAQGLANVLSGLCGGLSGSSSVIRTTSNFQAGGRTNVSVVFSALLLVLFVGFFGPALSYLPVMATSGLLLVVGIEIIDKWTYRQLKALWVLRLRNWRSVTPDLTLIGIVVTTAAIYGLPPAIGVGMLASLAYFAFLQGRSLVRRVFHGDKTHSRTLRDSISSEYLRHHGQRILILELEGALFFASTEQLEKKIENHVGRGVDHIILDMRRIVSIDTSGVESLKGLWSRLEKKGIHLAVSYVSQERRKRRSKMPDSLNGERRQQKSRRDIWRKLEDGDAFSILSRECFFSDTDTALAFYEDRILLEQAAAPPAGSRSSWKMINSVMFDGLTPDELKKVRRHMSSCRFPSGSAIFSHNEEGKEIYFLREGAAHVLIPVSGSERLFRVSTLRPGTVFGEMALFNNGRRSANVVAKSPCFCYRLTVEGLETLKRNHPQTALKLFENLGRLFAYRLQDANDVIRELEA